MLLEKTREFIGKSKFNAIIFWVLVIGILIGYFSVFFQRGIIVEDNFLRKYKNEERILYKGSDFWGDLKVFLIGRRNKDKTSDVIFELPGNVNRYYSVTYTEADNWFAGISMIRDGEGTLLFSGSSSYHGNNIILTDTDRTHFPGFGDNDVKVSVQYLNATITSPYTEDYTIPLNRVAAIALATAETTRGNAVLLIAAILIMAVVLIDFGLPLLFFNIKTAFLTDYAEPSDVYIFFQRLRWTILPILSLAIMITALLID